MLKAFLVSLLVSQCLGAVQQDEANYYNALASGEQVAVTGIIDEIFKKLLENLRDQMPNGFPQWNIPPLDPLHINDLPWEVDQDGLVVHANLTDGTLTKLSTFNIDTLHIDVLGLKLTMALSLNSTSLTCNYFMDAQIAELFPLWGSGPCSVEIDGLTLSAFGDISLNHSDVDSHTHLQLRTLDFDLGLSAIDVQIHNLFGDDTLAGVMDGFVDEVGPMLIDILVNDTKRDFLPQIIEGLNKALWNVSLPFMSHDQQLQRSPRSLLLPGLTDSASADALFNQLLPFLGSYFASHGLDPFPLPEVKAEIGANTGIKLYRGHLSGLSTIVNPGGSVMAHENHWISIGGGIKFNVLSAGYALKLEVFGIGPEVSAEITLTGTQAVFQASCSSEDLTIRLDTLKISNIGSVHVTIRGLGIYQYLLEPIVDLIVDLFKGTISDAISGALFDAVAPMLAGIDLLDILKNL